jgi:H+/gluconate symporter-like permease
MTTNRVHITNTPIFDELAREMGYQWMIAPKPLAPAQVYTKVYTPAPLPNAGLKSLGRQKFVEEQTDEAVDAALVTAPDLWKITEEE